MAQKESNQVHVSPQGRVVIPVRLRRALDIRPGETLLARAENGRLVLEKPEAVLSRLRARFAAVPPKISLADELIAGRQEETQAEAET